MRTPCLLALVTLLGCGAKTDLEVGASRDAEVGCTPREPARFSGEPVQPLALAGGHLWGTRIGPELAVGVLDGRGRWRAIATEQPGVRELVADGDDAWWSTSGGGDGRGAIVHGRATGGSEPVVRGLTQPGALDLDGPWLTYGDWTNLPGPGDDGRASMHRIDRDGSRLEDLAVGLGMPTASAHLGSAVFWLDRRRATIATVAEGTLEPAVIAEIRGVRRPMIAWNGALYVAALRERNEALIRVEERMPPEPAAVATFDAEVRRLHGIDTAAARGVAVELFEGRGSRVVYYRLADHAVLEVGSGSHPAADATHLYWSDGEGVMRVCLASLQAR